jgi:Na+/proline symporter
VIAAILAAAMSNLSAALNSLASTTVMDFYRPLAGRGAAPTPAEDARYLRLARYVTLVWGAILFLIGWIARNVDSVLEAGLSIASVLYGALLGVFLLGLLTKRPGESAAMFGMTAGLLVMLFVKLQTSIAWTWYVLIGTAVTFLVGWAASFVLREAPRSVQQEIA